MTGTKLQAASSVLVLSLSLGVATVQADVEIPPAAISASTNDGNVPANAVDGSLATRWSANGDGQWLRLDLGGEHMVTQVAVAAYRGTERRNRFDLQVSGDGTTWVTVTANAQTSGTSDAEEAFAVGQAARFVRYLGHGSNDPTKGSWNSVTEISVFAPSGIPTATPTPEA